MAAGTTLLDFIRYHRHLTGTKIGCREGDCGACTVLVGDIKNGNLQYRSATSCLMAIGNAAGKHIVSIEGINGNDLNLVQQAFAEEGATQCGFCTPGFIVSLTGFCFNNKGKTNTNAIESMNGNICRCTGYKSIERAAEKVVDGLKGCTTDPLSFAIGKKIIPEYFAGIKNRLQQLQQFTPAKEGTVTKNLGGGTDLYVQQHDTMHQENLRFTGFGNELKSIVQNGTRCEIGGAVTVTDLAESELLHQHFKDFSSTIKLVSSTPIRNMATIAGNLVNASPIGDFSIFLLALDAQLALRDNDVRRNISLGDFYKGYKQLDKSALEIVEKISFELPAENILFSFEKVSKRTHLDIASVNSAMRLSMNDGMIEKASLTAGGVGPIPMLLKKASAFLAGKKISTETLSQLLAVVADEISPISDARGTAQYKRLLLQQLIKTHVLKLFPSLSPNEILQA